MIVAIGIVCLLCALTFMIWINIEKAETCIIIVALVLVANGLMFCVGVWASHGQVRAVCEFDLPPPQVKSAQLVL